jgi:hypothetical protein
MLNIPFQTASQGKFHFPSGMNSTSFITHGLPLEMTPTALWKELGLPMDLRLYFAFSPLFYATGQPG